MEMIFEKCGESAKCGADEIGSPKPCPSNGWDKVISRDGHAHEIIGKVRLAVMDDGMGKQSMISSGLPVFYRKYEMLGESFLGNWIIFEGSPFQLVLSKNKRLTNKIRCEYVRGGNREIHGYR